MRLCRLPLLAAAILIAPLAAAHEGALPDPSDARAFLRHAFEDHDCVMTEAQLIDLYLTAGFGMVGAREATAAATQRHEVKEIAPATWRYVGSVHCSF